MAPSRASQYPDNNSRNAAAIRYALFVFHCVYAVADAAASVMPIVVIVFGVRPIFVAAFAWFCRSFWVFCFSFVSILLRRFWGLILFGVCYVSFVVLCGWCLGVAVVVERLVVGDKACLGVRVDLPNSAPLLVVVAERGFVMCGFLNVDVAERLGVAAAVVSGVKTFEDVLGARVKAVTGGAAALGVKVGMSGAEALKCMF